MPTITARIIVFSSTRFRDSGRCLRRTISPRAIPGTARCADFFQQPSARLLAGKPWPTWRPKSESRPRNSRKSMAKWRPLSSGGRSTPNAWRCRSPWRPMLPAYNANSPPHLLLSHPRVGLAAARGGKPASPPGLGGLRPLSREKQALDLPHPESTVRLSPGNGVVAQLVRASACHYSEGL